MPPLAFACLLVSIWVWLQEAINNSSENVQYAQSKFDERHSSKYYLMISVGMSGHNLKISCSAYSWVVVFNLYLVHHPRPSIIKLLLIRCSHYPHYPSLHSSRYGRYPPFGNKASYCTLVCWVAPFKVWTFTRAQNDELMWFRLCSKTLTNLLLFGQFKYDSIKLI